MPDWTIKAGDNLPVFSDTLEYSNGEPINLEGATVTFVMRALTAAEPLKLTGTTEVTAAKEGKVVFLPSEADTATPGNYMANWSVVPASGKKLTVPTTGYLWVEVEPSLTNKGGVTIVGLGEVKEHCGVDESNHTHDGVLTRFIKAVAPLIENVTGPILTAVHDEWYEGGNSFISLRHAPSYGYGSKPYLQLMACSEYRGPIEYNLNVVGTPTAGSVYSTEVHAELGMIVRRTSGGGTYAFWSDPSHPAQSIHVVYASGQESVPENVNLAALETIRWWYETTQAVGKGALTLADSGMEGGKPMVALPYHAEAMLAPLRKSAPFV